MKCLRFQHYEEWPLSYVVLCHDFTVLPCYSLFVCSFILFLLCYVCLFSRRAPSFLFHLSQHQILYFCYCPHNHHHHHHQHHHHCITPSFKSFIIKTKNNRDFWKPISHFPLFPITNLTNLFSSYFFTSHMLCVFETFSDFCAYICLRACVGTSGNYRSLQWCTKGPMALNNACKQLSPTWKRLRSNNVHINTLSRYFTF